MTEHAEQILVVDDNPENADMLVRRLVRRGYAASSVDSGQAALEALSRTSFDLVLMDVMMPVMDGYSTLACIRDQWDESTLPVIMVTAESGSANVVNALEQGANDYITKPIDFPALIARLRTQIERRRAKLLLKQANENLESAVKERTKDLWHAHNKLAVQEAQLRTILDNTADGIVCMNDQGEIQTYNRSASKIFGYLEDEVIGRDASILFQQPVGTVDQTAGSPIDRILAGQEWNSLANRAEIICEGLRKDGSVFPLEMSLAEFDNDTSYRGRERLTVLTLRDVSERRELEAKLRQSQKMDAVGRLTGAIAHDFNNLLTVIVGNLQLLDRSLQDNETALRRTEKIMKAAKGGGELTRRLLNFSRQQMLETEDTDINELVTDMQSLLQRLLGEHIDLNSALDPTAALATTDRNQLEHALLNLCINARDAMPEGGTLTIETRCTALTAEYAKTHPEVIPGDYVEIAVTDSGTGISEENLGKIFDPFFTTKEIGKGTGLGLSSVFGFMKQAKGHVSVYSEVGVGTTFRLFIPRSEGSQRPNTEIPHMQKETAATSAHKTVLVVEDDAAVREIAVSMLVEAGYDVIEAESGAGGLEVFNKQKSIFDLVFTDVIMPGGITGPEMVEKMRQQRPDLPVIFASGYAEQALRNKEHLLNSADFITKPYEVGELHQKLMSMLET